MWAGPFESYVGWRYLLRVKRRPQVLVGGLLCALAGVGLIAGAAALAADRGAVPALLLFGGSPAFTVAFGIGVALAAVGLCVALFGALNTFLTAFSAFSAFMVAIGVMVVILVLGVMNGFQGDLRTKIVDTQAHVVIEAPRPGQYLPDYRALAAKARTIEGVQGATPFIQTEIMFTAPANLQPALLKGIEAETVGQANRLPETIREGKLENLDHPERVKPFDLRDHPALADDPEATARDLERRIQEMEARLASPSSGGKPAAAPSGPGAPSDAPGGQSADDAELAAAGMEIPAPGISAADKPGAPLPAAILGAELRRNLNLWPGETVNVVSPLGDLGPNGPVPKSRPFRVAGWFESGMLEFDSRLAYTSMASLQRYLGLGDVAGGVQVRVTDLEQARAVRDRLRAALGEGVRVSDWQELNSNLFGALKLEKIAMFLVLSINILLAAFAITATLVMTIIERRRQIAILNAMGAHQGGIIRIFMSQGAFNGAVGAIVGASLGLGLGAALAAFKLPMDDGVYYLTSIPVDVRAGDVGAIMLVALAISMVSTLYPAYYAARLRPVEGLVAE